ncbi:hypothetical protein ABBQ32_013803 [Trebouxia sp. C0010 RCD-2024]
MSVGRASTSQHMTHSHQSAAAHAAPRHLMTLCEPDIHNAMEGLSIPGPAGALHTAQAAGLQIPRLHDLGLHPHARTTASQQHVYHQMHPDFLTPAWQSAMEALDLVCFSETSPMLQHHVKRVMLCQSSCKVPKMVLLVDSLRHTGCGDAFAQLKVQKYFDMTTSKARRTLCHVNHILATDAFLS